MSKVTQAHIDARTSSIAAAANRVFARKGFSGATMQEIAAEAGLSAGAIYRYFPSKEAIIAAMGVERRARLAELVEKARAEGRDAPATIARLADIFFTSLARPDALPDSTVDMELWVESSRNPAVRETTLSGVQLLLDRFEAIARRGQELGEIASDADPRAIAEIMMALRQGLVLLLVAGQRIDVPAYISTMVKIMTTGIRPAGAPAPSDEKGA